MNPTSLLVMLASVMPVEAIIEELKKYGDIKEIKKG